MGLTVTKIPAAGHAKYNTYLVCDEKGTPVGLLEKWKNTRTDTHPWKAYVGVGMVSRFAGAFYPEDGGKKAALAKIQESL